MISTRNHGILDYVVGVLLIATPWLLGFADVEGAKWIMVVLGAGALGYSVITDYELGAVRIIPMSVHLALDVCSGLLLAASPWLFGFSDRVSTPHVALGLFEIGAAVFTSRLRSLTRVEI